MKKLLFRKIVNLTAAFAAVVLFLPPTLTAQSGFLADYTASYSGGSLTTYNSLSDAMAGSNALVTNSFPTRDLQLYLGFNTPYYGGDFAYVMTNWSAGPPGEDPQGTGNPNNTNNGFLQLYDTDGGSVTSQSAFWDPALTTFHYGANGNYSVVGCPLFPVTEDCGRMWNGENNANAGSFISWDFAATAAFLNPAVFNIDSGLWETEERPTSLSGTFSGIFADATTSQFYKFSASLGQDSWAVDEGYVDPAESVLYGADAVATVPEPATMSLMAMGLVGLAAARKRRKNKS